MSTLETAGDPFKSSPKSNQISPGMHGVGYNYDDDDNSDDGDDDDVCVQELLHLLIGLLVSPGLAWLIIKLYF